MHRVRAMAMVAAVAASCGAALAEPYEIDFFPDLPGHYTTQLRFIGPQEGTITNTRFVLEFTTIDGFDAGAITFLLVAPVPESPGFVFFTGADLEWSGPGTFTADVSFPDLNGQIAGGLWVLDIGSVFDPPEYAGSFSQSSRIIVDIEGGGVGCDPDLNQDGNADQDDVFYLVGVLAGGENPTGIDPDFNRDGNADQDDLIALIEVIAGGACP
jgi:hypothetical protein